MGDRFIRLVNSLSLLLLFLLSNVIVLAQTGGSTAGQIAGTVKDPQGFIIAGATITARNLETNSSRTIQTSSDGSYLIVQLSPGTYQVKAEGEGFAASESNVTINIGTTALVEFTLSIGSDNQNIIEVIAGERIEGKTESSTNIQPIRISNLPINRRNFLDFSITAPRVLQDRLPASGFSATSGLSFNGQMGRSNNVTIDGLDNNDIGSGSVRSTFSQEAVREFQIVANSYSAEFGRALGGIINIVTENGSNEFHGKLFFFNRNDEISARDPFVSFKPPFSQYQFGGVLGGPIKRDKAFFFASFERLSLSQNQVVGISDEVVASAQRQGFDLRNGAVPFSIGQSVFQMRVDGRINSNNSFWIRYNGGFSYNGAFEPIMPLIAESNGGIQRLNDNTIALNNTYINPSLNLVNETRFLYARRDQGVLPLDDGPLINLFAPEGEVIFGRNMTLPQLRDERIYQIVNNVTLTRGRNVIKMGVDYQTILPVEGRTTADISAGGGVFFAPLDFTANRGPFISALQAFDPSLRTDAQKAFLMILSAVLPNSTPGFPRGVPLAQLSLPVVFSQGFGNPDLSADTNLFSLFIQDDIKLKQNLLIKAGLRYDRNNIDFTPSNNGNFSPRLSFSYRPERVANLHIHGAYGLFFGVPSLNVGSSVKLLKVNKYQLVVLPFPFSVLPFALPERRFPESRQVPAGVTVIPQLGVTTDQDDNLRASYSQQTDLGIDYQLPGNLEISLAYTFVRGIRLLGERNINPVIRPVPGNAINSLITGRVDPTQGEVLQFGSAYDSYYHGFTTIVNRRFKNRFDLLASYTFSKAIDNVLPLFPGDELVLDRAADPLNTGNERGLSIQDARHRFVLSGVFELNYDRSIFLKDYRLSTIFNVNSGRPFNLLAGADLNMNGDSNDRPAGLGRNVGIAPGFATLDMRLERKFNISESANFQILFEVFNLLNRVNIDTNTIERIYPPDARRQFDLPPQEDGRFILTPDRFRSAFAPRQFQFGFRLNF